MADIEITTNSPKVVADLQSVQKTSKKTSSVIATDNAKNKKSFETLSGSIGAANNAYNNMGNTVSSVSALIGEFGPVLETAVEQISVVTAALTLMNGQLIQSIANMTALTASTGLNTASMSANLAQNVLSTEKAAILDAMILQTKGTMDAYTQSISNNSLNLEANRGATEALLNMILAINELMLKYSETIFNNTQKLFENKNENYSEIEAIAANMAALELQKEAVTLLSSTVDSLSKLITANSEILGVNQTQTENSTTATDANNISTKENAKQINGWNIVGGIMTGIKETLSTINALNNILNEKSIVITTAKLIKDKMDERQSRKQAIANTAEATTQTAVAAAKAGPLAPIIIGVILGAVALAVGVLSGISSVAAMATGGVVSAPTVALVGEGRYPEAVVPLGDSPQFASMKADIAGAVLQGLAAMNRGSGQSGSKNVEVVLNIDGDKFARAVLPAMDKEYRRKGRTTAIRSV